MGYARILYLNRVTPATITSSAEDTGYPDDNVINWRDYVRWHASGANSFWIKADLGQGALSDTFDDLTAWAETDPNGTLSAAAGALTYDSGANANDLPYINQNAPRIVTTAFQMELVFNVAAWATCNYQNVIWLIRFINSAHFVTMKIEKDGANAKVTANYEEGTGSQAIGNYTLGGLTGRIKIYRNASGTIAVDVYDDNDSTYHSLGSFAGDSDFQVTTLHTNRIQFTVNLRTGGSFQITCATLYHSDTADVKSWGIAGHNLNTQGVVNLKLQGAVGDVGYADISAVSNPSNDFCLARCFTEIPYRYYRMLIDNNGGANFSPQVGIFFVGSYLEFPELITYPYDPDEQRDHSSRARGESGNLLGIVNDWTERRFSVTFMGLTQTWIANTWQSYWDDYRFQSFIWLWDYTNYQAAAYLMAFDMDEMEIPFDRIWRQPLTLEMIGRKEE